MRGESGRVSARVRALLDGGPDEPAGDDVPAPAPATGPSWRQRLAARIPVRLDPGRRAALGVGLAVLVAVIVTGWWLVAQRPHSIAISAAESPVASGAPLLGTAASSALPSAAATAPASASPQPQGTSADVVVDVAGKVHHPGLYRLPPGSRVDDAVRAAGGPLPGTSLTSLNLAARVGDGQQIVVGTAAPAAGIGASGASPDAGGSQGGPVSLNSANVDQLEGLPGVGPVLAQHILDWRAAHGRFDSIAQLQDVSGIGPAKFAALKSLVTT